MKNRPNTGDQAFSDKVNDTIKIVSGIIKTTKASDKKKLESVYHGLHLLLIANSDIYASEIKKIIRERLNSLNSESGISEVKSEADRLQKAVDTTNQILDNFLFLHQNGLGTQANLALLLENYQYSTNIAIAFDALLKLELPITQDAITSIMNNGEYANLMMSPFKVLKDQQAISNNTNPPILTAKNQKILYQNAAYADDINTAFRHLTEKVMINDKPYTFSILQDIFDAVILLAQHNELYGRSPENMFGKSIEHTDKVNQLLDQIRESAISGNPNENAVDIAREHIEAMKQSNTPILAKNPSALFSPNNPDSSPKQIQQGATLPEKMSPPNQKSKP